MTLPARGLGTDTEAGETLALNREVLLVGRDPGMTDHQRRPVYQRPTYGPITGQITGQGIRDTPPGVTALLPVSGGRVR